MVAFCRFFCAVYSFLYKIPISSPAIRAAPSFQRRLANHDTHVGCLNARILAKAAVISLIAARIISLLLPEERQLDQRN
jgi:hypothetical protein